MSAAARAIAGREVAATEEDHAGGTAAQDTIADSDITSNSAPTGMAIDTQVDDLSQLRKNNNQIIDLNETDEDIDLDVPDLNRSFGSNEELVTDDNIEVKDKNYEVSINKITAEIDAINERIHTVSKGEMDDSEVNWDLSKLKEQKAINTRILNGMIELQQQQMEKERIESDEKKIIDDTMETPGLGKSLPKIARDVRKHRSGKIYVTSTNSNSNLNSNSNTNKANKKVSFSKIPKSKTKTKTKQNHSKTVRNILNSFEEGPRQNLGGMNNNNENLPESGLNSNGNGINSRNNNNISSKGGINSSKRSNNNNINNSQVKPGTGFSRFGAGMSYIPSNPYLSKFGNNNNNSNSNRNNSNNSNENSNNSNNEEDNLNNNNSNSRRFTSGMGAFNLSNAQSFGFNSLGSNFNYNNSRGGDFAGFGTFAPYNENMS